MNSVRPPVSPAARRLATALLSLLALALPAWMAGCAGKEDAAAPLYCYVGGTMRPAMEELVRRYEKETGRRVEVDYGDSGQNLIKAETSGKGDLYVGHDPFHGAIERKGLGVDAWVVATIEPVIVVTKGNPKKIAGLADLARPGLKVVLTDARYSTAGYVWALMFNKANLADAIAKNVVTTTRSGGEAANAVVLGNADAAIVWNAVQFLRRDKLDAVPVEPAFRPVAGVDAVTSATFGPMDMGQIRVTIDVLKSSRRPDDARKFAEYVASDAAAEVWKSLGFGPAPATKHLAPAATATAPAKPAGTILLYAGAGLRDAMDELTRAFKLKTGVTVETDYGGSGMLISRLRLSRRGDLFFPGDLWYVELAEKEDLVASKAMICYFVPVILVPKGNPKQIRTLADLARPGLRLGLGDPRACQVGRACEAIIAKNKLDAAAIQKNLVFSSVTVNELGVQLKAGGLDATIVWDAVAAQYADSADVVPIPAAENEVSRVAIGVLKTSVQPDRAEEFVKFLQSPEGQAIFKRMHYRTEAP